MDDKNQQSSGSQISNAANIAGDNSDAANPVQNTVQSQVTHVGILQKEYGVVSSVDSSDFIKPSEIEPNIHHEAAEVGVETVSEMPKLTEEHAKVGIGLSKEATPVQTSPSGAVQLPMTAKQAKNIMKTHNKITDSVLWLAVLVLRQIKKINMRMN